MLKRTHRSVVNPFSMHVIARRIRFAQRLSLLIIALFVFLFSASARAEIDSAIAAMPDAGLPHYRPEPVALPSDATYLTPDGSVTVIGYNDMQGLLESLNRLFIASHPGFKFNLILKGTRTAPAALTSGASAFAPMGAEFSDDDMETYRKKFGADPISIRVAHASLNPRALSAPIAIYVNKANPLTSLTTEQVTRLFTQPNLTWTDFGWTDEPGRSNVHPIGLTATTALGIYMTRHAFSHAPFASNFKGFVQSADVVKQVGEDPSAVGFAAMNRLTPKVKILAIAQGEGGPALSNRPADIVSGNYAYDRHLLIYARKIPGAPLDPFVREYLRLVLSYEGQRAIAHEALNYLPLNPQEITTELSRISQ